MYTERERETLLVVGAPWRASGARYTGVPARAVSDDAADSLPALHGVSNEHRPALDGISEYRLALDGVSDDAADSLPAKEKILIQLHTFKGTHETLKMPIVDRKSVT